MTFIYFSFTTLSTVGFGDFHPRTNIERFLGAFILLVGVTVTSYITERLSTMIVSIRNINSNTNEDINLGKFFATLVRFNEGKPLN